MGSPGFLACGATALGFGIGIPPILPIQWDESFPFIVAEMPAEANLAFLFTVGTYPSDTGVPELYELDADLLIKAWLGPFSLYAGGGVASWWQPLGASWEWTPRMSVVAGAQLWILSSFTLFAQVRSLDSWPPTWTLHPTVALGTEIAFASVRPSTLRTDGEYLWLLVGLGVLALLAYYPRV